MTVLTRKVCWRRWDWRVTDEERVAWTNVFAVGSRVWKWLLLQRGKGVCACVGITAMGEVKGRHVREVGRMAQGQWHRRYSMWLLFATANSHRSALPVNCVPTFAVKKGSSITEYPAIFSLHQPHHVSTRRYQKKICMLSTVHSARTANFQLCHH